MSSRCLFRVSFAFLIKGRGIVLEPGITPAEGEKFRVGDTLRLVRPNGSSEIVSIAGFELFSGEAAPILLKESLTKEQVPVGTEVWSIATGF